MSTAKPREAWLDRLKGLGMLLVMYGHASAPPLPKTWIHTFHVPLFFFASGFVFLPDKYPDFKAWWVSRWRTLAVPYLLFGLLGLVGLAVGSLAGAVNHSEFTLPGALLGLLAGLRGTSPFNGTLWFVACLLSLEMLRLILHRAVPSPRPQMVAVLALSVLGTLMLGRWWKTWPMAMDIALCCLVFHWTGSQVRKHGDRLLPLLGKWPVLLALGTLSILISTRVGFTDLFGSQIGAPLLFHLLAFLGTFAMVGLSRRLPDSRLLDHVGRESLTYLALHQWIVLSICSRLFDRLGWVAHGDAEAAVRSLVLVLVCLASIGPVTLLLGRFAPWWIGRSPKVPVPTAVPPGPA